jgi:hypothetical protein
LVLAAVIVVLLQAASLLCAFATTVIFIAFITFEPAEAGKSFCM